MRGRIAELVGNDKGDGASSNSSCEKPVATMATTMQRTIADAKNASAAKVRFRAMVSSSSGRRLRMH